MRGKFQIVFLCLFISIGFNYGQNNEGLLDDYERIAIAPYIPSKSGYEPAAERIITSRLQRLITKNGMGSEGFDKRFIITSNFSEITKDILGTAPPIHAITLEVNFYIGDGREGTLYETFSKVVKGVGENPAKAQIAALKNIRFTSPELSDFIAKAKVKIIEYYNSECDFILKEASNDYEARNFDKAVATLMKIPKVCKECYEKAKGQIKDIQLAKLEHECQQNISKAKSLIAKDEWDAAADCLSLYTPSFDCYEEVSLIIKSITDHRCAVYLGKAKSAWAQRDAQLAGSFLANIPTDSECSKEAESIRRTIANSLDEAARKRWELAYEKYNRDQSLKEAKVNNKIQLANRRQSDAEADGRSRRDLADREMSYKEQYGFDLEKARIKAARDVGVAYGKNQPETITTYNLNGWW